MTIRMIALMVFQPNTDWFGIALAAAISAVPIHIPYIHNSQASVLLLLSSRFLKIKTFILTRNLAHLTLV